MEHGMDIPIRSVTTTGCCMFSATVLSGCETNYYGHFSCWTAGQRVDPTTDSAFIWKVKSADMSSEAVSSMPYMNWLVGQPDFGLTLQSCLSIVNGHSYGWDNAQCDLALCSVCEL